MWCVQCHQLATRRRLVLTCFQGGIEGVKRFYSSEGDGGRETHFFDWNPASHELNFMRFSMGVSPQVLCENIRVFGGSVFESLSTRSTCGPMRCSGAGKFPESFWKSLATPPYFTNISDVF